MSTGSKLVPSSRAVEGACTPVASRNVGYRSVLEKGGNIMRIKQIVIEISISFHQTQHDINHTSRIFHSPDAHGSDLFTSGDGTHPLENSRYADAACQREEIKDCNERTLHVRTF
jgi:hypothetical protein